MLISCQKKQDEIAPQIESETVLPYKLHVDPRVAFSTFQVYDNLGGEIKYFIETNYFDTYAGRLAPDTFSNLFAGTAQQGATINSLTPNNTFKSGFYELRLKAGDQDGNTTEKTELVYFNLFNRPVNNTELIPFNQSDTVPFWSFNKQDSLIHPKVFFEDPDSLIGFRIFTLPYGGPTNTPTNIYAYDFEPTAVTRLDSFYHPFSVNADTAYLMLSLENKKGESRIYTYPTIFK